MCSDQLGYQGSEESNQAQTELRQDGTGRERDRMINTSQYDNKSEVYKKQKEGVVLSF